MKVRGTRNVTDCIMANYTTSVRTETLLIQNLWYYRQVSFYTRDMFLQNIAQTEQNIPM
jgi:hypothetical protein